MFKPSEALTAYQLFKYMVWVDRVRLGEFVEPDSDFSEYITTLKYEENDEPVIQKDWWSIIFGKRN